MKKIFLISLLSLATWTGWAQCGMPADPTMPAAPATSLSGQALKDWLKQNWYDGKRTSLGYNTARDKMYGYIDNNSALVRCVYGGYQSSLTQCSTSNPANINCEHTIPQSFFGSATPYVDDIHHLFPTIDAWNNVRSNYKFAEITDAQTTKWMRGLSETSTAIPTANIDEYSEFRSNGTSSVFEPREDHKGNLARAIFYFFTMHPTAVSNGITSVVDNPTLLYQWHLQDPVDATELQRNTRVAQAQGNYNPYIAYPELVARAWGFTPVASDTLVSFVQAVGSVVEGNAGTTSYTISVNLSPAASTTKTVAVQVTGGTADASDFTLATTSLTFAPGVTSQLVTVNITGDAVVEPNETVVLSLANPSTGVNLGLTPTHTITITNDDGGSIGGIPTVPIDSVRNNRADGTPYMNGKSVRLYGTVYGGNINKNATNGKVFQFTLVDATNGVAIYSTAANTALPSPYTVTQGDSLRVVGKVTIFRGLTEIVPDSMTIVATNRPIKTPLVVDTLDESTESNLVRIENLTLSGTWPTNPTTSFNVNVTNGTDIFQMRIDNDVDLYTMAAPTGTFHLIGIGGQFATASAPYSGGYQILPRWATDIIPVTGVKQNVKNSALTLYPNPAQKTATLFVDDAAWTNKTVEISISNALGQIVKSQSGVVLTDKVTLSVAELPQGVYTVSVASATQVMQKQLVVTK